MLDRTAIRLRISLYLDPGLPHSSLIHHFNPVFRFPDLGAQGSQTGEVINLLAHATDARFLSLSPLPVPPSEGCDISTGWAPWQQICAQMRADGSNTVSLDKKILSLFDITFKTCTVSTQMRINMKIPFTCQMLGFKTLSYQIKRLWISLLSSAGNEITWHFVIVIWGQ